MGKCGCGFTTDEEKNCNGTHKIVKSVREKIAQDIESIGLGEDNNQLNGLGMRMLAAKMARDGRI